MPPLLHFRRYGADREGPVLLPVHPLGADLEFWDECVGILSPHIPCVVCDLRSAGRSPRASAPVTLRQHVADLDAVCVELDLRAVVPVGCAIGAMMAAAYAAAHPGRTHALVLSNPTVRTSEQARANLSERCARISEGGMQAILPAAVDRAFVQQPRDDRYRRYMKKFADQDAQAYVLSTLGILDADIAADLAALRCPSLVVAGAHDVLLPPAEAEAVQRLISGARYGVLGEAAHFPPYQKPAQFAALVLDFLREIREAVI